MPYDVLSISKELTIEQSLQQGILAHRVGKLEHAERFYRTPHGMIYEIPNHNVEEA